MAGCQGIFQAHSTYGWLEKLWLEKLKQVASHDKCSGKVALEGDSIFSSLEDRGGEERVVIAAKGAAFLAYGSFSCICWTTHMETADEAVLAIVDQETVEDFCLLCESDVNDILELRIIMADSDQKIHEDGRVSDVLVVYTIFLVKQYPPLKGLKLALKTELKPCAKDPVHPVLLLILVLWRHFSFTLFIGLDSLAMIFPVVH
ncbi:hypothetical protein RHSIM_Rhsim09G0030500 [Rhododendron simsii]|uniref:Uncharacterized protein n=1 Tax=Rhododendron simsii TaxID=118357 RepID=A0A834GC34_RHOSS|nr:hypothetical protein RHSIM_Rhsim09G0030500 [Rhododendron simsii]